MGKLDLQPQNDLCRISKCTRMVGVITSDADMRIDGVFEGTLYTKGKLVVGETSKITGKVYCQGCDLWGHLEGDIYVEDIINMKADCHLTGSVKAPKVGIEIGSVFNGTCNIITTEEYNKYLKSEEALKNLISTGKSDSNQNSSAK